PDDSSLAGPPASLPAPLHPDQRAVAQSRRALVRPADGQTDQAGGAPKHADPRGRDPHLYRPDQHGAEALRVDEDRRRDLGQCSSILSSNLWDRTLVRVHSPAPPGAGGRGYSIGTKMQWRSLPSKAFDRWPLPQTSSTRITSPAPMRRDSPSLAVICTPASRLMMYWRRGAGCQSRS